MDHTLPLPVALCHWMSLSHTHTHSHTLCKCSQSCSRGDVQWFVITTCCFGPAPAPRFSSPEPADGLINIKLWMQEDVTGPPQTLSEVQLQWRRPDAQRTWSWTSGGDAALRCLTSQTETSTRSRRADAGALAGFYFLLLEEVFLDNKGSQPFFTEIFSIPWPAQIILGWKKDVIHIAISVWFNIYNTVSGFLNGCSF